MLGPGLAREHGVPRDLDAIKVIIVHTIGGPICKADLVQFEPIARRADDAFVWRNILRSAPVADAHFVIGRRGSIEQVMPVAEIAQHTTGANAMSIGIELVHSGDGRESFEPSQIAALIGLINRLRCEHPRIAWHDILGHDALDRRTCRCHGGSFRRRQDPGANFPWKHVLAAVRLPSDPTRGVTSLTPLEGQASPEACPTL